MKSLPTIREMRREMRLLIETGAGQHRRGPDRSMLRLLAQARRFNEMVLRGDGNSIGALAFEAGVSSSYFTRVLKLSFLAPAVVRAILDHQHPLDLSAKRLSLKITLPNVWSRQKAMLLTA